MSVDEAQPRRPPRPPGDAKLVRYDEYIDKQIRSTSRTVKAVDFATAIVVLVAGVLAFLLTVAVVEHWLVPGGFDFASRCVLFGLLVVGAGWFAYRRIWPLCLRAINPVYAAQTIEHVSPSLKNSLINLLLFRQHRSGITDAVYQTLEEQAAQRLTRVPVDSSVDHTQLIRFGYVLLAVVAAGALYKVFSPKDPLVAAERVLMPWAEIVPASRVSIKGIEPGRVTITRGEFLDVSAEVLGIGESDPVLLRFTTADGRAVNKPIVMKPSNAGLRFVGRLPDAEENGSSGVAQNLTYRIEAGDARSLDYKVEVIAAPAILVERIDYDYPQYTGFVDRTIEASRDVPDPGQIRAIEGTRVTIHARANGPIDTADVDFDADGRRDLRMSVDGERAKAAFELALRDDRQTPQHLSYVLRLTNDAGRTNRDPVKYPIEVVPDYSPEVAIQSPPEKSLNVRLDDTIVIEVEASDPDFALSDVRLHGEAAGRPKIDVPLLADKEHPRKFTGRFRFIPRAHKLQPGDNVQYWIVANDIRSPKPNSTATEKRIFRIMSPDPAQQPPPDRIAQRDQRQQQGGQNGQQGEKQPQGGQGQQGAEENQGGENGQQQQGESGQQKGNEGKSSSNKQQNQGQGGPSSGGGESASADGKNSGEQNGKNGAEDNPARSQQNNGQGSQNGKQNQQGSGQQQSDGKQTGAGAAGGESPQQGAQPDGTRPDQAQKSPGGGGKPQIGSPSESKPVSPEGDDDGTAFERIREHMQRKGEMKEGDSESQDSQNPNGQQQNGESAPADGKPKPQSQSAANGNQKQNGTEQSPSGDTQQPSSRDAQGSGQKSDAKQKEKHEGQSTKADGAEEKNPHTDDQGKGPGADTRQDDLPQREQKPSETGEKENSPGGQQTSTKGESGAGEQPGENQGVPDSKEGMKPSEKRQQSSSQESKNDDKEPPAPGEGKRESDSQGEMGGDRPGGGEEGGGQKTNRDGTGSAGQNQSADEGGGESSEKGAGNNSPNAGQDAKADHRTGQPGTDKQQGSGSRQEDGQGNQPGGKPAGGNDPTRSGNKPQGSDEKGKEKKPGESAPADGKQNQNGDGNQAGKKPDESASKGNQSQDGQQPKGGGTADGGGGDTGATAGTPPVSDGTAPDGDTANLDYARRQTDLVLEKLADQLNRRRVDDKMLKELGWTEDDLRAFVERWQRRKDAARNADPAAEAARRELDDALRSLGLRRGKLQQNKVQEDRTRDLREGYRGPVPLEYQERLRAYNQGISRAQQERE